MQVNIFATLEEKIEALADSVINAMKFLDSTRQQVNIAVSGGRSPIALFKKLSEAELNWQKVNIHLVDERIVDPTSKDSNELLVRQYLLQNNAKSANFNSLYAQLDSIKYKKEITNHKVDLVILGMGEDGHFASLFPDSPQLHDMLSLDNKDGYGIIDTSAIPHQRISMTFATILRAPFKYLSISGANKLNVLIEGSKAQNSKLPISYLLNNLQNESPVSIYWN